MARFILHLPAYSDKQGLLHAFASQCGFGKGFGYNWDALWDALNDWLEQQPMPLCLVLDLSQVQKLDPDEWQICLDILQDAIGQWPHFCYLLTTAQAQLLPDRTS